MPEATRQTQWDPGLYADVNVFVLKEMAQTHNDFTPGPLAPEVTRLSCPISSSPDPGQGSLCEASKSGLLDPGPPAREQVLLGTHVPG